MPLESAQMFVMKMKQDQEFRQQVSRVPDNGALWDLVKSQGYAFDEKDLAGAMAACMNEMEGCGE